MKKANTKASNSETRHGQIAEGRKRVSYIEDEDKFEELRVRAEQMHLTPSTLIREATIRFLEEVKKNGGKIEFHTLIDEDLAPAKKDPVRKADPTKGKPAPKRWHP